VCSLLHELRSAAVVHRRVWGVVLSVSICTRSISLVGLNFHSGMGHIRRISVMPDSSMPLYSSFPA
jgi:hypothetical protein